jgi:uncharacterized repeat protein (TIGR01451 family)
MPTGRDFICFLMLMFVFVIGCSYECCSMNRTAEVAWPRIAPPPQVAKAEPKVEKPVEPKKTVEDINPVLPIDEPKKEPKVEPKPEPVDPGLPDILEVVMDSNFEGDREGLVAKPANIVYNVTNKGQQEATCQVQITLPQGLVFDDNPNQQVFTRTLEKMAANATVPTPLRVVANKPGTYTVLAEVKSGADTVHTSKWQMNFRSLPQAEVLLEGPTDRQTVGSAFTYTVTVFNKGMEPLRNAKLESKIQASVDKARVFCDKTVPEADRKFDETTREIAWNIAELAVGDKNEYKVTVTSLDQCNVVCKARIKAQDNSVLDKKQIEIVVGADIGLTANQYDTNDPVEVGKQTIYVIEINNTGYKDATKVVVEDTIPSESKFVNASVEGPELPPSFKWDDTQKKVIFDAVDSIKPGQKVTYKITVEVVQKGDLLNSAAISTADFDKPITKQEGTKAVGQQNPVTEPDKTEPGKTEPDKTEPDKTEPDAFDLPDNKKPDATPDNKTEPVDFPE